MDIYMTTFLTQPNAATPTLTVPYLSKPRVFRRNFGLKVKQAFPGKSLTNFSG